MFIYLRISSLSSPIYDPINSFKLTQLKVKGIYKQRMINRWKKYDGMPIPAFFHNILYPPTQFY